MTSGSTTVTSPWFVRPPSDHPARMFCFPFSGSGASAFSAWPAAIDDVEVSPVQFPGRENRLGHPHYDTYENLAAGLVGPLEPLLDRPFAFFGHCAGALPAYESVLRLAELGLPGPDCLFVSGQPAPHDASRDRMLTMTEPELRAELESFIRGRGMEPRPDMIDMGMVVLLRDHAAAGAYRRVEPVAVPCPIVVLHWRDDPDVSLDELQGWRGYADSVEFRVVDGGHYDFMDAPDELLKLLTSWR
ncbi:thioesterase II family protein [Streptomyces sp. NPDC059837]|jgi:surfactin synthase thioesterase subunit|uniref:thioesterase II family protein n=1 Tax=unclassified Streptomyces TaxID=2593676 RepID=UPI00225AD65B|nr:MULTISPECIES: alpha/beta fold hydrolase [unclassified Streptomyces]MCX4409344.1 thioesterase domain-containing protein [Streptomyces sp. NBC_01764]MCX4411455.1 thioesterase domain-containing protein [Streptomyces sp. NBC_01764]MCX5191107.1 thioesterase domain-containing protein [Streptomyces sp. NBC_00268]MCX5192133.1 thioesterase domain-containing protein [Streptomyces sp. NBC_00268]MCX5192174.1 thioesterase domain-containing protein [Streptomyces sp. NBC_00268]